MTIEIKITADTAAEAKRQMADLLGGNPAVAVPQDSPPKASAQRAAPKAETQASSPSQAPSATSPETQSGATTTAADGGATFASHSSIDGAEENGALDYGRDVKPAVLKVSGKFGRKGVQQLLAKYEVDNAQNVPAERWPDLIADVENMLQQDTLGD